MGQTDPKGQNTCIIDHGDLLINREKAFCECKYLYVLSRKLRLLIKSLEKCEIINIRNWNVSEHKLFAIYRK